MILLEPAFYDLFGLIVFIFLIYLGVKGLKKQKIKPWMFKVILTIGILGLIVDFSMVMLKFIL